ncbi:hypothetical protein RRG08_028673 [Elysia crispata]|uniref:Uncharacterized protein n=1 Tax=Elysia crispata TaxID=231223 RepID=A0AAE0ZCC1_9GAST|nr:hypothetical protein RRG08_028673 [Elysia crispata]
MFPVFHFSLEASLTPEPLAQIRNVISELTKQSDLGSFLISDAKIVCMILLLGDYLSNKQIRPRDFRWKAGEGRVEDLAIGRRWRWAQRFREMISWQAYEQDGELKLLFHPVLRSQACSGSSDTHADRVALDPGVCARLAVAEKTY